MTREINRATNTEDSNSKSDLLTRRRVLKTGAGVTAAAVGLPAASGVTAAHFHGPEKPPLAIDIKPESEKNTQSEQQRRRPGRSSSNRGVRPDERERELSVRRS